jgi:hypothetical protein
MSNRRHLFISHHHADDEGVSKLTKLLAGRNYDIRNSSIRVNADNKRRLAEGRVSDAVLKRLLRMKVSWASTVVVLIGKETHQRPWVKWEIDQAHEQGKRIVGIYERGGTEADIPPGLEDYGATIVAWNSDSIINAIDGDGTEFQLPDGSPRPPVHSGNAVC